MLKQYSMFLLQILQAAKALLFLFPHSFPFDGCSTCCLIFFVFCFVLFQKWPSSSPLSALSKRLNLRLRGEEWNCGTRVKPIQNIAKKKKKKMKELTSPCEYYFSSILLLELLLTIEIRSSGPTLLTSLEHFATTFHFRVFCWPWGGG